MLGKSMAIKKVRKAVFPVGGLGTRFLPATKAVPKEMLPVANKPLIQYAYEEAIEAGIEEFVFVTGRNKEAINKHFDHAFELQSILQEDDKDDALLSVRNCIPMSGHIAYIPQQEPSGLGHAVWCARHFVGDEPFAIILPDEMVLHKKGLLAQMVEAHASVPEGNVVAVAEVPAEDTYKYGIIDPIEGLGNALMGIRGMVEKPAVDASPSRYSLTGRYILQPNIFEILSEKKKGAGGEVQLTDAMQLMLASDQAFYGFKFEGKRFDCGNHIGFLEANIAYTLVTHPDADQVRAMLNVFLSQ